MQELVKKKTRKDLRRDRSGMTEQPEKWSSSQRQDSGVATKHPPIISWQNGRGHTQWCIRLER